MFLSKRMKGFNYTSIYRFSTSHLACKENLKNAKKFKPSSQSWLLRQINDNFVKLAKRDQYRCRSAYKLLEIQEKYKIFKPGQAVVDLGCAPGSWTQVAVKFTKSNAPGSKSVVVGVDLSPVHPVEGATVLSRLDLRSVEARRRVAEVLAGRHVNVVVSDMAPSASGIKSLDHTNIVQLCYSALDFAKDTSMPGATLVMKVFDGNESKKLATDCRALYEFVRLVRPEASRKESSELFYVCLNYKGSQFNTDSESVDNEIRTALAEPKISESGNR